MTEIKPDLATAMAENINDIHQIIMSHRCGDWSRVALNLSLEGNVIMRTINSLILLTATAFTANSVNAGPISDVASKLMSNSPEAAFNLARQKDDLRLITIPFCGGATPGFNFRSYSGGNKPQENNLGIDCYSLLGEKDMEALQKLESWVAKYNSLVFKELNNGK